MSVSNKEIIKEINEVSDVVTSVIDAQKDEIKELKERLDSMEARSQIIPYEASRSENPELARYLKMGSQPMETKDLSVTGDGQGVSVRGVWSDRIFEKVVESSPIRSIASIMKTNSDALEVLVDRDEPASEWIGELDTRVETATSFMTRHRIEVHEHYALPAVTLQMLEDSQFNVENWLMGKLVTRFSRQEANAFISGDGNGKPRGILDYALVADSEFTWGNNPDDYKIGAHYTGASGDIENPDVLIDLVDSLKAAYLPNASWLMTRAFRNKLRKLKDGQDRYLYIPSLDSASPDRLLGYPVYLAEDMPAIEADAVGALFGDFRQAYTIVDRTGITAQRDAVTQPGWVKFYCRRRVGGALTNPEAVKALVLGEQ